jgi:hypothetical protein
MTGGARADSRPGQPGCIPSALVLKYPQRIQNRLVKAE